MMHKLANAMKMQAQLANSNNAVAKIGTVSSYNPDDYCAKIMLQPENIETGWLPIGSDMVGNGWGIWSPPQVGNMVVLLMIEGNIEVGIIIKQLFNDVDRPISIKPGEFFLVHQSGSLLKFHNDGSVDLASHTDLNATVGGNLNATVIGAAKITAASVELNGGGTAKGIVQGDCICALTGAPHPMVSVKIKGTL